jgi:hypothetical protein
MRLGIPLPVRRWRRVEKNWTAAWQGVAAKAGSHGQQDFQQRTSIHYWLAVSQSYPSNFYSDFDCLQVVDFMVRALGLEPRTNALKGRCSTN